LCRQPGVSRLDSAAYCSVPELRERVLAGKEVQTIPIFPSLGQGQDAAARDLAGSDGVAPVRILDLIAARGRCPFASGSSLSTHGRRGWGATLIGTTETAALTPTSDEESIAASHDRRRSIRSRCPALPSVA
jgi:hypothetical protein